MKTSALIAVAGAVLAVSAISQQSSVAADRDACTLLTATQISAAAGFSVGNGTHVTPTFVRTCTWSASGGAGAQTVTPLLETGTFFDGAKRNANLMTAAAGATVKSAGVGDDSYYLVQGTNVDLWVKKG